MEKNMDYETLIGAVERYVNSEGCLAKVEVVLAILGIEKRDKNGTNKRV